MGADLEVGVKVPVLPDAVLLFCGGINIGFSVEECGCGSVDAMARLSLISQLCQFSLEFDHEYSKQELLSQNRGRCVQ